MAQSPNELIFKYLSGDCSEQEVSIIERWINDSPDNQKEFNHLQTIWEKGEIAHLEPNIDLAWNKVKNQTLEPKLKVAFKSSRGGLTRLHWLSGIAASIILIAVAVFSVINTSEDWKKLPVSNQINTLHELPDGSRVWLKNDAKLSYYFTDDTRSLRLSGEAYFDVRKNSKQPFIVSLGAADITVVGTSFYAKSELNKSYQVSVTSGVVVFTDSEDEDKSVTLKANEEALLELSTNNIIIRKIEDPNLLTWQSGEFVFNKTPLSIVISQLAEYYNVEINLENDDLGNCLITSKFNNQSVDEVLDIIGRLLSAELIQTEESYLLKGKGC
ncbi:MAG: FecR domain-containing protein [Cyclobacteriaceae bacterium]